MFNYIATVTMNTAKIPLGMVLPFLLVWQKNANAKAYLAEMKRTGSEATNDLKRNESEGT